MKTCMENGSTHIKGVIRGKTASTIEDHLEPRGWSTKILGHKIFEFSSESKVFQVSNNLNAAKYRVPEFITLQW